MSEYWHGLPPVVKMEVGEWPWEKKMSEKKIVVSDDRVNRVWSAVNHLAVNHQNVKDILEAFAADLSENPIVPTPQQVDSMRGPCGLPVFAYHGYTSICTEWQRRMFLAPEPEVPEAIKDLLGHTYTDDDVARTENDKAILEAYRRGKKGL